MVLLKVSNIDWDEGNCVKCQKHGVSIEEIEYVLLSDETVTLDDEKHSSNLEMRYIALGKTAEKRWIFIAYTFRLFNGVVSVRPISARYMHNKEIANYGQ